MLAIDDVVLARALHVLFIVHWIGGVAFVTLVGLPLARAAGGGKGWALFESIEKRFARQVRVSVPLAGVAGFWMTFRLDLWARFRDPTFWWMDAMVIVWTLFMAMVFVAEPLAHKRVVRQAASDPDRVLARVFRVHLLLLALGAITILGAVAGSRGGFFQ